MSHGHDEQYYSKVLLLGNKSAESRSKSGGTHSSHHGCVNLCKGPQKASKAANTVEISARTGKPKRRKAVRACTNCQRTHLTCDDNRPCERCIKRGCADTCVDGIRKKVPRILKKHSQSYSVPPILIEDHHHNYHQTLDFKKDSWGMTSATNYRSLRQELKHNQHAYDDIRPEYFNQPSFENEKVEPININHTDCGKPLTNDEYSHHVQPQTPFTSRNPYGKSRHQYLQQPHPSQHPLNGSICTDTESNHIFDFRSPEDYPIFLPDPLMESLFQKDYIYSPTSPDEERIDHLRDEMHWRDAVSDKLEPLDSNPLPVQSYYPKHSFFSIIPEYESESVISSMLHNRSNSNEVNHSDLMSNALLDTNSRSPEMFSSYDYADDGANISPTEALMCDALSSQALTNNSSSTESELTTLSSITNDNTDRATKSGLINPRDIYCEVTTPFPYKQAFRLLVEHLQRKLNHQEMRIINKYLEKIIRTTMRILHPLSCEDRILIEQCFQRSLLEEYRNFSLDTDVCLVWRQSGDIVAVSPRFASLTQRSSEELHSQLITAVMDNMSILKYFQKLAAHFSLADSNEFQFQCTLISRTGESIPTEVMISIHKDLFNMPSTILGKFLEVG